MGRCPGAGRAGGVEYFGQFGAEGGGHWTGTVPARRYPICHFLILHQQVEVGDVVVKAVEAEFFDPEEQDEQAGGETEGQAANVDHGGGLVFEEVSPGEDKIILKHRWEVSWSFWGSKGVPILEAIDYQLGSLG